LEALNSNKWVGGILCDLTEASDYVNHNILLSKLEFYCIAGKAKNLIKSYFNDRYQRVRIKNTYLNNHFSEWEKVKQGVPQGSVLGPLFFLLYINDLPGIINDTHISKPTIFADDTNIIITHPKISAFKVEINTVIEKISNWFQTNLLVLNFNKTYYMHFSTKSKLLIDIQLSYKGNPITNMLSTGFLGLTLDNTLSWNLHIEQLSSKLNSACYVIRLLKTIISTKNLSTVYFAYVHSIITYGIVFWGSSPYSKSIFKLQKRVIRIIMKVDNRVSWRELFKKLNILPLYSQYILSILLFVVNNIEEFTINSDVHSIRT